MLPPPPPPPPPPSERPGGTHLAPLRREHHEGRRLRTAVALSIAVISVVGAVISWRAEVHASAATDLDQEAVAASITSSQLQTDANRQGYQAQAGYDRYLHLRDNAQEVTGQTCDQNIDPATLPGALADANCQVAGAFTGTWDPSYIPSTNDRGYDVQRYANDVQALAQYNADANPQVYRAQAAAERSSEDRLLWLSLVLVAALALCTIAQLERRRFRTLLYVVPGWLLLTVSAVLLLGWEG